MALSCPTSLVLQHHSLLQLQWPLRAPCLLRTFVQGLPVHIFSGLSSPSPQRKISQPLCSCILPDPKPVGGTGRLACLLGTLSNNILSSFIFCLGNQASFVLLFSQVGSLAGGVLLLGSPEIYPGADQGSLQTPHLFEHMPWLQHDISLCSFSPTPGQFLFPCASFSLFHCRPE